MKVTIEVNNVTIKLDVKSMKHATRIAAAIADVNGYRVDELNPKTHYVAKLNGIYATVQRL